jgi:hypothetical protein
MSDRSIPLIVTVAILALMFAWVQLLNFAFPRWRRFLKRRLLRSMRIKRSRKHGSFRILSDQSITDRQASVPRSSRSLKDQSRDLFQALSAVGERGVSRSQPTIQRVPSDLE